MSARNLILGLDIGTTNIKCLAVDERGVIVAQASDSTPVSHPQPDWTDFDPESILAVASGTIRSLVSRLKPGDEIGGIAVASVAESVIPIDSEGEPLAPAIAWFDLRTTAEFEWICEQIGYNRLFEISGLNPDPMFGICKILWIKKHRPEAFRQAKYWLHLADYVAFKLCGVRATDPSLACRTLAYNLRTGQWDIALLEAIGIDPSSLPPICRSGSPLGPVTLGAAAATGLPATAIVSVGSQDHISGSFAASGFAKDLLVDSIGTSESLMMVSDHFNPSPALPEHGLAQGAIWVDSPLYFITGGICTAGSAVEWFRRELTGNAGYAALIEEASRVEEGIPIFLPHLIRSLTPYPDAQASGAFIGLKPNTTRAAMFRAVLEGLAFEARAILDAMVAVAGHPRPAQIITIGASLQNRLLAQIKAEAYGTSLKVSPIREVVGYGVALLAGIGCGLFRSPSEAVSIARRQEIEIEPDPRQIERLELRYEKVYSGLFAQLRGANHRLHALSLSSVQETNLVLVSDKS
jgi:xylulokinase